MTTSTITAPVLSRPTRSALVAALFVVVALVVGGAAGAVSASWWQSRSSVAAAPAGVLLVTRPALDPAARLYGARAADREVAALAVTGSQVALVLDPEARRYGPAFSASVDVSSPGTPAAVGAGQVHTPETRRYGALAEY